MQLLLVVDRCIFVVFSEIIAIILLGVVRMSRGLPRDVSYRQTYLEFVHFSGILLVHLQCHPSSIRTSSFIVSRFGVSTYRVDSCTCVVFIASYLTARLIPRPMVLDNRALQSILSVLEALYSNVQ